MAAPLREDLFLVLLHFFLEGERRRGDGNGDDAIIIGVAPMIQLVLFLRVAMEMAFVVVVVVPSKYRA